MASDTSTCAHELETKAHTKIIIKSSMSLEREREADGKKPSRQIVLFLSQMDTKVFVGDVRN